MANLTHHITHLVSFKGRETRSQFWPYAVLVVVLMTFLTTAVMVPFVASSFSRIEQYARQRADSATARSASGHRSISVQANDPELMPDISNLVPPIGVLGVISISLLAAAVARRLRDAGKPPALGLAPLPFLAVGLCMMPSLFAHGGGNRVTLIFLNNMLYLATLAALLLMLASPSLDAQSDEPARVTPF